MSNVSKTTWWAVRSSKGAFSLTDDGFPMLFHFHDDAVSEALMCENGDDWRPVQVRLAVNEGERRG